MVLQSKMLTSRLINSSLCNITSVVRKFLVNFYTKTIKFVQKCQKLGQSLTNLLNNPWNRIWINPSNPRKSWIWFDSNPKSRIMIRTQHYRPLLLTFELSYAQMKHKQTDNQTDKHGQAEWVVSRKSPEIWVRTRLVKSAAGFLPWFSKLNCLIGCLSV